MSTWIVHEGDCLDVLRGMDAGSVDAVVTDPPYSVSVPGSCHVGQRGDRRNLDFFEGDDDWAGMTATVVEAATECMRVVKDTGSMYWWCGHRQFGHLVSLFEGIGWSTRFLVWNKKCPTPPPPGAGWPSGAELCVYAYRPGRTWHDDARPYSNVLVADGYRHGQPGKVAHPTQKREMLMRLPIDVSSNEGDTILDPFCGSGTTGVACMQTGRNFIGVEIDPGYAAIARRRIGEAANHLFANAGMDQMEASDE